MEVNYVSLPHVFPNGFLLTTAVRAMPYPIFSSVGYARNGMSSTKSVITTRCKGSFERLPKEIIGYYNQHPII